MYDDKKKSEIIFDWRTSLIRSAILFGIIFIVIFVVSMFKIVFKKENASNITSNLQIMKVAATEYFVGSKLPIQKNVPETITLEEMLEKKIIIEFFDQDGKACNLKESYSEITKVNATDYTIKVKLVCNKDYDYIISTVSYPDE